MSDNLIRERNLDPALRTLLRTGVSMSEDELKELISDAANLSLIDLTKYFNKENDLVTSEMLDDVITNKLYEIDSKRSVNDLITTADLNESLQEKISAIEVVASESNIVSEELTSINNSIAELASSTNASIIEVNNSIASTNSDVSTLRADLEEAERTHAADQAANDVGFTNQNLRIQSLENTVGELNLNNIDITQLSEDLQNTITQVALNQENINNLMHQDNYCSIINPYTEGHFATIIGSRVIKGDELVKFCYIAFSEEELATLKSELKSPIISNIDSVLQCHTYNEPDTESSSYDPEEDPWGIKEIEKCDYKYRLIQDIDTESLYYLTPTQLKLMITPGSLSIDTEMSASSSHPVQNKVIKNYIDQELASIREFLSTVFVDATIDENKLILTRGNGDTFTVNLSSNEGLADLNSELTIKNYNSETDLNAELTINNHESESDLETDLTINTYENSTDLNTTLNVATAGE